MTDIQPPGTGAGNVNNYPSWVSTAIGGVGAICGALALVLPMPWVLIPVGLGAAISAVLGYQMKGTSKP